MSTKRATRLPASDRSMDTDQEDRSELFFFPKHTPPVSIRATSREEAEAQLAEEDARLEDTNPHEA